MSSENLPGVAFVDLDGTLILGNSYHIFLRSVWDEGGWRLRADLMKALGIRVFKGKAGRVPMKRYVADAFSKTDKNRQDAIIASTLGEMRKTVSQPIQGKVNALKRAGWRLVLATAALDCYARPFAIELGYDDCLATPTKETGGPWQELWRHQKAYGCHAWLRDHGGSETQVMAISDHADDLPLLETCTAVVLQTDRNEAIRISAKLPNQTTSEIIDPVAAEENGGIWLWILDSPSGPHDPWEVKTILSKHRYALMYVGDGEWRRVVPGDSLLPAVSRVDCPRLPSMKARLKITMRRKFMRDILGVFH